MTTVQTKDRPVRTMHHDASKRPLIVYLCD
jgi:hypothetical protein